MQSFAIPLLAGLIVIVVVVASALSFRMPDNLPARPPRVRRRSRSDDQHGLRS